MEPRRSVARRVVPDTKWRDLLVAVTAGLAVLAFTLYAVFSLGRQVNSTGWVQGVIVGKEFVARRETQVTFGTGGVHSRLLAGDYFFRVKVPQENGKVYRVSVDPSVYAKQREGEPFSFVKPQE